MRDGKHGTGDPEGRRPVARRGAAPPGKDRKKARGFVERATASGHSGYGSESVRPYLRDQLRLKALLPSPFPAPESEPGRRNKDDHHQ